MSYGIIQGIVNNVVGPDPEGADPINKFFVNLTSPVASNVDLSGSLIIFNEAVAGTSLGVGYYILNFENPDADPELDPGLINFQIAEDPDGSAIPLTDVADSSVTFLIISAAVASNIDGTPISFGSGYFQFDYTSLLRKVVEETTATLNNSSISSTGILKVGSGVAQPGMQLSGTGIQKGQRLKSTAAISTTKDGYIGPVARISFVQEDSIPFVIGQLIKVSGIEPYEYNGDFEVIDCTNTFVEYQIDNALADQTKSGVVASEPLHITEKYADNKYKLNLDTVAPFPTPVFKIIESINAQSIIISSAHGYTSANNGLAFRYLTDGVPADNVLNGTQYYIRVIDSDRLTLHDTIEEATNDDDNTRITVAILQNQQSSQSQQTLELQGTSTITGTLYPIHTTLNVIANNSRILGDKAKGDGIRIISPWEWLGQSGMVRYLESQGANLDELKAQVDQIEKS